MNGLGTVLRFQRVPDASLPLGMPRNDAEMIEPLTFVPTDSRAKRGAWRSSLRVSADWISVTASWTFDIRPHIV